MDEAMVEGAVEAQRGGGQSHRGTERRGKVSQVLRAALEGAGAGAGGCRAEEALHQNKGINQDEENTGARKHDSKQQRRKGNSQGDEEGTGRM